MSGPTFFPHPVLGSNDDIAGSFEVDAPAVLVEGGQTIILFEGVTVANDTLQQLLGEKRAIITVKVECAATMYRRVHKFTTTTLRVEIPADDIDGRVDVSVDLCAAALLAAYKPVGLNADYGDASFRLDSGTILGIGGRFSFISEGENETGGVRSWVQVRPANTPEGALRVDFDGDRITVFLSDPDWKAYRKIEQHSPSVIHTGVVFPVIVEAIRRVRVFEKDPDDPSVESCSQAKWFGTLRHLLETIPDAGLDPYTAASSVLRHPLRRTWTSLQKRLEGEGD